MASELEEEMRVYQRELDAEARDKALHSGRVVNEGDDNDDDEDGRGDDTGDDVRSRLRRSHKRESGAGYTRDERHALGRAVVRFGQVSINSNIV
jgi:hypothetical protein